MRAVTGDVSPGLRGIIGPVFGNVFWADVAIPPGKPIISYEILRTFQT